MRVFITAILKIMNRIDQIKKLEKHHNKLPIAYKYFLNETQEDKRHRLREHNNIFKFDDLEFTLIYVTRTIDNYPLTREVRAYVDFDNGFYVSILNSIHSHGAIDEYEIAILDENGICYDTPLTNDVVGHLDKKGVEKWLKDVSELDYNNRTGEGFLGLEVGNEDYEILKDYKDPDHG
jgi:hypothetical protein